MLLLRPDRHNWRVGDNAGIEVPDEHHVVVAEQDVCFIDVPGVYASPLQVRKQVIHDPGNVKAGVQALAKEHVWGGFPRVHRLPAPH